MTPSTRVPHRKRNRVSPIVMYRTLVDGDDPLGAHVWACRMSPVGSRLLQLAGLASLVAVCTGHGLKDPDIVTKDMQKPVIVPPKLEALSIALE